MNIYLHVEVAARELDSKLLIAVIAAAKGHDVLLSDLSTIINGAKSGFLSPGIFHTKSLTPGDKKIARHQMLRNSGFKVTSIDEEGGLVDHGYDKFAKVRYSDTTLDQVAAVFCWGMEDMETLKRIYPDFSVKFHQTGSPRADLWRPELSQYWSAPKSIPDRPYLLVSSNMGSANNMRPFHENILSERRSGYYQRDPEMFSRHFGVVAEEYRMMLAFIEAIHDLASSNSNYDIVLRPHPVENIETWKVYLEDIPGVHVIREGSISAWVNHAFAVMHNGCTTALEASISGRPVVTYLPFEQDYAREIPNEIGERVANSEELSKVVGRLFGDPSAGACGEGKMPRLSEAIIKKIYLDDSELAAEKIVRVWEKLDDGSCSQPNNWRKIKSYLSVLRLKMCAVSTLKILLPRKFGSRQENYKFPPMSSTDIRERVDRLQQVLGLNECLECQIVGERAVNIRIKNNR